MKKVLIILLISIISCYYQDYKEAYAFLEKRGYIEKIKKLFIFMGKDQQNNNA